MSICFSSGDDSSSVVVGDANLFGFHDSSVIVESLLILFGALESHDSSTLLGSQTDKAVGVDMSGLIHAFLFFVMMMFLTVVMVLVMMFITKTWYQLILTLVIFGYFSQAESAFPFKVFVFPMGSLFRKKLDKKEYFCLTFSCLLQNFY